MLHVRCFRVRLLGITGGPCKSGWTDQDAVRRGQNHVDPKDHAVDGVYIGVTGWKRLTRAYSDASSRQITWITCSAYLAHWITSSSPPVQAVPLPSLIHVHCCGLHVKCTVYDVSNLCSIRLGPTCISFSFLVYIELIKIRTNFSDAAYFYVLTFRSVVRVSGHDREPCKMDELIGMRFDDRAGPENHVLNGGAHWRHLANTINRCVQWRPCDLLLSLL